MKAKDHTAINLQAPENWNELTLPQLRTLCRLIASGIDPTYRRQLVFMRWTGIRALPWSKTTSDGARAYLYRKGRRLFWMTVDTYRVFLQRIDFCGQRSELSNQLLPHVRSLHRKLYGPGRKLYNLNYDEFIHSEAAYNRYLQHPTDLHHLNALCAVLYRPGNGINPKASNFTGDRREPFNDYVYMQRASWFNKVALWKRIAIFLYYSGSREALYEAHEALRENVTIGDDFRSDIEKHRELVNTLNQGDVTKTQAVYHSSLWDVFGTLNNLVIQNKKLQKR